MNMYLTCTFLTLEQLLSLRVLSDPSKSLPLILYHIIIFLLESSESLILLLHGLGPLIVTIRDDLESLLRKIAPHS